MDDLVIILKDTYKSNPIKDSFTISLSSYRSSERRLSCETTVIAVQYCGPAVTTPRLTSYLAPEST